MWSYDFIPRSDYCENMSTNRLVFSLKNILVIQGYQIQNKYSEK